MAKKAAAGRAKGDTKFNTKNTGDGHGPWSHAAVSAETGPILNMCYAMGFNLN